MILSGGQKQRVALARAFLEDGPIMILDDPVSQVDTQTAARITNTFRSMAGRKTLLIASHRISALRHADRIVVLDNGRITAAGNHEQMMAAGGYYARAHHLQELEDAF